MLVILFHIAIVLIVLGLVFWAVAFLPLPEPFPNLLRFLCVIAGVIAILQVSGIV